MPNPPNVIHVLDLNAPLNQTSPFVPCTVRAPDAPFDRLDTLGDEQDDNRRRTLEARAANKQKRNL